MKPMLAVEHDPSKLVFPMYFSPKIDGLRYWGKDSTALSRSLKPFPNKHVQKLLGIPELDGFDGEITVGEPWEKDCIQQCTSFFMAHDKVGKFQIHLFDQHDMPGYVYDDRLFSLCMQFEEKGLANYHPDVQFKLVKQTLIEDLDKLAEYESKQLALGYEGIIGRRPDGLYKYGRSTIREGYLLKFKRFSDAEAVVIGFEEEMENLNEKKINELGRSKRSSHKAGLVGKDTLGAFLVRDIRSGVEFSIGSGITAAQRKQFWLQRERLLGQIIKYKSFLIGVKDAPRHPVFIDFRSPLDMS